MGAPRKDFNKKFCQVEITVQVLLIMRLLPTYTSLFCYRHSYVNAVRHVQCVTHCNRRKACTHENHFQLIKPFAINVNTAGMRLATFVRP